MASEAKQATVEDYFSDESNGRVLDENFPRKASPAAANVRTRRSNPSDLKTEKEPAHDSMHPNIDVKSDSGYSSFTQASKTSADSAPSATASRSPPAPPAATTAPIPSHSSPSTKPRRPTIGEQRQQASASSPRPKPMSRTASVSSKQRPSTARRPTIEQELRGGRDDECTVPDCTTCGPNALPHRRRPQPSRDLSDQLSQRSDPSAYHSPPSPTYTRQPAYAQGRAVVQPATTRRRSSSTTRPRPQTFAGEPGASYWVPGMGPYPNPQEIRGPPPSNSAYHNFQFPQVPPFMPPPSQPTGYYPHHPEAAVPYDMQRPMMTTRPSYNTRPLPATAPIITQEHHVEPSKYSARYAQAQQPPTPTEYQRRVVQQPRLVQAAPPDDQSDEYTSGDEYEYEAEARASRNREALALMPPPALKRSKSQNRPPLAHARTSQVIDRLDNRRQSVAQPERPAPRERERERDRERDRAQRVNTEPPRRSSVSRPPPPQRQTQSEYPTRRANIVVNNSRPNRRQSYTGYEKTYDTYASPEALEDQYNAAKRREKRSSRIIVEPRHPEPRHMPGQFETDDEEEDEPVAVLTRPRRKTDTESRKGKERTAEVRNSKAVNAAEEYINATRGSRASHADQINRAAKRASYMPPAPSDSGSSRSNGSGNQSISKRTDMTSNGNNEIRLRVDGSAPLSLQFTGDMEGRTLQLLPAENGMTDVVIGNAGTTRGSEVSYRSERGSVSGNNRKAIVDRARRDAEDMISERSSRSGRSRREREEAREVRDERGHVLRRSRTNTTYH